MLRLLALLFSFWCNFEWLHCNTERKKNLIFISKMVAAKIPGIIPLGGTLTWNNFDHQPFSVAKHNIPEILTNQNQHDIWILKAWSWNQEYTAAMTLAKNKVCVAWLDEKTFSIKNLLCQYQPQRKNLDVGKIIWRMGTGA